MQSFDIRLKLIGTGKDGKANLPGNTFISIRFLGLLAAHIL